MEHFTLQVDTLPNCNTIIYSLSWAPADLNCIVAGTSGGNVFIWDVGKHKILQDIISHKEKKVFCVAWNQKDARRIASAGKFLFVLFIRNWMDQVICIEISSLS